MQGKNILTKAATAIMKKKEKKKRIRRMNIK